MSEDTTKILNAERHLGRARTSMQAAIAALPEEFFQTRDCLNALDTLAALQLNVLFHSREDNDQPHPTE